jgi:uncharacterized Fe-S cluster-containing protein
MPKPDRPQPETYGVRHGISVSQDSTAMRAGEATRWHQAATLITAFAALLQALTGLAVVLLHYF